MPDLLEGRLRSLDIQVETAEPQRRIAKRVRRRRRGRQVVLALGAIALLAVGLGVLRLVDGPDTTDVHTSGQGLQQGWDELPPTPSGAIEPNLLWMGDRLLAWGGMDPDPDGPVVMDGSATDAGFTSGGAVYDPSTGAWAETAAAPTTFELPTLVWTGEEAVIVGRESTFSVVGQESPTSLLIYEPGTDRWRRVEPPGAGACETSAEAWTGEVVLFTCGANLFRAFDPDDDSWTELAETPADLFPPRTIPPTIVWAGDQAIVMGEAGAPTRRTTVASYDPNTDTWTALPAPTLGWAPFATWTGNEVVLVDEQLRGAALGPDDPWRTLRTVPGMSSIDDCSPALESISAEVVIEGCATLATLDPESGGWTTAPTPLLDGGGSATSSPDAMYRTHGAEVLAYRPADGAEAPAGASGAGADELPEDAAPGALVAPEVLHDAAQTTLGEQTARFEGSHQGTNTQGDGPALTSSGAVTGEYDPAGSHLSGDGSSGRYEQVVLEDAMFFRGPSLSTNGLLDPNMYEIPAEETWVHFPGDRDGTALAAGVHPDALLRGLALVPTDLEVVGTEEVRGAATTHLRTSYVIDGNAATRLGGYDGAIRDLEVWIDDEGRVRRIDTVLQMDDGKIRMETSVEIYDLGAAIDVTAPEATPSIDLLREPFRSSIEDAEALSDEAG